MTAVEASDWGNLEWEDPQLRRSKLVETWSKKPEHFRHRVIRPRPSRILKYLGLAFGLSGLGWFAGLGFAVDHIWPGYLESTHVVWWHVPIGCAILFGPYLVLTMGGAWLWGKGAKRKR